MISAPTYFERQRNKPLSLGFANPAPLQGSQSEIPHCNKICLRNLFHQAFRAACAAAVRRVAAPYKCGVNMFFKLCGRIISAPTVEKMDIFKNFVPLPRQGRLRIHKAIGNRRIRAKSRLDFLRHHRAGKHGDNKLRHGHRPPDHICAEGDGDNEYQRAADEYSARNGHEH